MSKSGVESSIGDDYQSLIAAFWAAALLANSEILDIEIDATSLIPIKHPYGIDDVVIRYHNGKIICCQCKKNHPRFTAWTANDLAEDLRKAWEQWLLFPESDMIFYSRTDFGRLARLQERARVMEETESFLHNLPDDLKEEYHRLNEFGQQEASRQKKAWQECWGICFLKQLSFETMPERTLHETIRVMLRSSITYPEKAMELLLREIDKYSRRAFSPALPALKEESRILSPRRLLTRAKLVQVFEDHGLKCAPERTEQELIEFFVQFSRIGRIWPRKISGQHIPKSELVTILHAIRNEQGRILLHGGPGSGKTCILLDLMEKLENSPDVFPVFFQARDYNEFDFEQQENTFISNIARMAEIRPVVLLIDSLDVLSISRDSKGLRIFLALLHGVESLVDVTTVVACRTFDVHFDTRLASIQWSYELNVSALNFALEVTPLLTSINIDCASLNDAQKQLLTNPRMLSMYVDICTRDGETKAATMHDLAESYVQAVILHNPHLGRIAYAKLQEMASYMLETRRLSISSYRAAIAPETARILLSEGVLTNSGQGTYLFSHQTLVDILSVAEAMAQGQTLLEFILALKPVPFIRPSVRAFLLHLRIQDASLYRKQARAALSSDKVAFHLKRLIACSFAECIAEKDDWPLFRDLFIEQKALFETFFSQTHIGYWFSFFESYFLPEIKRQQDGQWLLRYAERLSSWDELPCKRFVDLWLEVLENSHVDQSRAATSATFALTKISNWHEPQLEKLFKLLNDILSEQDRDFLGKPLSCWVRATDSHDDFFWEYLTREIDLGKSPVDQSKFQWDSKDFCEKDFLFQRFLASEALLSRAVAFVEEWRQAIDLTKEYSWKGGYFLKETSHPDKRTQGDMRYKHACSYIFIAIERACQHHAGADSDWWKANKMLLAQSPERALQYMALQAALVNPQANLDMARFFFSRLAETNGYPFEYELSLLLTATAFAFAFEELNKFQYNILHLYEDMLREDSGNILWVQRARRDYLVALPAPFRLPESLVLIDEVNRLLGPPSHSPPLLRSGGFIHPPFSYEVFMRASEQGLFLLLEYYGGLAGQPPERDWDFEGGRNIGGASEVARQFADAVSRNPERFGPWALEHWLRIHIMFREAVLEGMTKHINIRFGNTRYQESWEACAEPTKEWLCVLLLDMLEGKLLTGISEMTIVRTLAANANIAVTLEHIKKICFLLDSPSLSNDPSLEQDDDSVGLNSTRGIAAEAAMHLIGNWITQEQPSSLPDDLTALLRRFARDEHPGVRAMVLRSLPHVQHHLPEFGWELFDACFVAPFSHLWSDISHCLYYRYYAEFDAVAVYLQRMREQHFPEAADTWGRIMSLALLSGKIEKEDFLAQLRQVKEEVAWSTVAQVFAFNIHTDECYDSCLWGLEAVLSHAVKNKEILNSVAHAFFDKDEKYVTLPFHFLKLFVGYISEVGKDQHIGLFHLPDWLLAEAELDYENALLAIELLMDVFKNEDLRINDKLINLLTILFREAEEMEDTDRGALLDRVLNVQDAFLAHGVYAMDKWLHEAERL